MNQKNIIIISIFAGGVLIFTSVFLADRKSSLTNNSANKALSQVIGNRQIVQITAKGGYWPRLTTAKAGLPVDLKVLTENTFDCSASLVIPFLGVRQILPPQGQTNFEIPAQKPGSEIIGRCSMGMYSFKITFE